jgi:hypothetical protein
MADKLLGYSQLESLVLEWLVTHELSDRLKGGR